MCANLISTLLIDHAVRILSQLHPDGLLVVAGILRKEFQQVQGAYEKAGLRLLSSRIEAEWRSGSFGWA